MLIDHGIPKIRNTCSQLPLMPKKAIVIAIVTKVKVNPRAKVIVAVIVRAANLNQTHQVRKQMELKCK